MAERWEGRAPGWTAIGSSDLYKGPLPGRAGALRRGASVQAGGPLRSSPGKEDSGKEEWRVQTVRLGVMRAASGPGPSLAYTGERRGTPRGSAGEPT